jgi:hypothetical protein
MTTLDKILFPLRAIGAVLILVVMCTAFLVLCVLALLSLRAGSIPFFCEKFFGDL